MKRFVVLLGISAAAVMMMTGCSSDRPSTVSAAAATPLAVQPATKPEQRNDVYRASGPLVVENQVDVAAQREGVVARITAEVGTRVQKGRLLAQLDDRQLQADRAAADAKVKSLTADLKHWEALSSVRDADLSRSEQMWKSNIISSQQLEHDRYSAIGSKFEIERQRQDLRNAQEDLNSLDVELEKSRIVAPFDGLVARRYVRAGQRVANSERLFWVTAVAPLNVKFTLPQELAGKVKIGELVRVSPAFDDRDQHAAKVTLVSPVVDPASGTIELQAQVIGEPGTLRPGMTVNVNVKPQ
ncbi:MAG: efflux RND transporter periplasmic adaptor subunit [Terriglobales bacterium]